MLFPTLKGQPYCEVNLEREAELWRAEHPHIVKASAGNPLIQPDANWRRSRKMIRDFHRRMGVVWSLGGWMEKRMKLLSDSYLDEDEKYLHLGADYLVRARTPVAATADCEVLHIGDDKDLSGGWGPYVFLRLVESDDGDSEEKALCVAHLGEVRCWVGQVLRKGEIYANIGAPPRNGNWPPHLHIQAMTVRHFHDMLRAGQLDSNHADAFDGYASLEREEEMRRLYPDPLQFVSIDGEKAQSA
jgi:hypothetical protein